MSERDHRLFLNDIIESIEKIEEYTSGLNFEDFVNNRMVIDAVIRNIEIIGEATANIPDEIRKKYPMVPWQKMKSMRNIVVHEYFGVNLKTTWKTIKNSLPKLRKEIAKTIKKEK